MCCSLPRHVAAVLGLVAVLSTGCAGGVPWQDSRQAVVGVAESVDSSRVTLRLYEKEGGRWVGRGAAWPGRLGKNGLAWGRGLHPAPTGVAPWKKEGDGRAPAGVFRIGDVYGLVAPDEVARRGATTYHRITPRDLWVEDVDSPHYNRHLRLPHPEPRTPWERKQQMRLNDPAHALKVFIAHNAHPDVVPGAGSAIFFHIWRANGARATTGCTTMAELKLREMIAWLDPAAKPVYVLLAEDDYRALRAPWRLP